MNLFPLSIALPLNTSLHSLYPFLSPDSSRNIIVWRTDNWQRYSSAKEETSLNLQEFYSVPLMWKFHHLLPGMLAMLHKHIKKEMEREATSPLLQHEHRCQAQTEFCAWASSFAIYKTEPSDANKVWMLFSFQVKLQTWEINLSFLLGSWNL